MKSHESTGDKQGLPQLLMDHATSVLTISGVTLYGVVRLGIDAFYSRLNVTAEEVGLSYASILSRAALGLIVLAALSITLASFLAVFTYGYLTLFSGAAASVASWRRSRLQARQIMSPWAASYCIAMVLLIGFILMSLFGPLTRFDAPSWLYILPPLVIGIAFGAALMWYGNRASAPARLTNPNSRQLPIGLVVGITGVLVMATLVGSIYSGVRAADRVKSGFPATRSIELLGLPWPGVLNVRAECVSLKPASGKMLAEGTPTQALYLGQADAVIVVYVPTSFVRPTGDTSVLPGGPVRVPAGDVLVGHFGLAKDKKC